MKLRDQWRCPLPGVADGDALGLDAARRELLGRREEQRRLAALLHGAREGQAGVLVLRGEAGIGKSALLGDIAKNADGFRIGRAGGVESEMELAYAALQQLCGPLAGHQAELSTLHRNVLDQVFGRTDGAPPERFLVGIAALDLVATAARKQPVVWLIDDAQWIDQASMQAIGFVARRLLAERALILIATRDVSDEDELAGLPELPIGGLSTGDARRLFDSVVSGPTDPLVQDRIISETRGNPLALLELPRAWTTAELVEGLSESASARPRATRSAACTRAAPAPTTARRSTPSPGPSGSRPRSRSFASIPPGCRAELSLPREGTRPFGKIGNISPNGRVPSRQRLGASPPGCAVGFSPGQLMTGRVL